MSMFFGNDEDLPQFEEVTEEEMAESMVAIQEAFRQNNKKVQTSLRFNEGKIQTREVYPDFIMGVADVLTKSRAKYPSFNWCKPTKLSTPYESLMRHLMAFQMGEDYDSESGKHHLLHCATNLMFMYYQIENNREFADDRFFANSIVQEYEDGEDC